MRDGVEEWSGRRTSRADDWPLHEVLATKAGRLVSVVLPARNEVDTVGRIVASIVAELGTGERPLVDEVVVVDSGSTDGTAEAAVAAGARVLALHEVLPSVPVLPGKGEALWRSLAGTAGDVLVFVDADLVDFSPDVVRGLLGPVLADPAVQLVKAVYRRPLDDGARVLPAGGGRVTELVARPLLNLHWPALAGVVQPLAGEYAATRGLLEQLPFPAGYGVELALLVDTLDVAGLDAIAQVDVGVRRHRNADDLALGRMAAEIMQAAWSRTGGRPLHAPGRATHLTQFPTGSADTSVTTDVSTVERPPMLSMPTYVSARRATGDRP